MTEFPKLLPTDEVTSLSGQQRLPYPDHGPTQASEKDSDQMVEEPATKKPAQKPPKAHLEMPRENLFQRAKTWFGFGRHL